MGYFPRLTVVFTGPPSCLGFQENPGSAAPGQQLLDAFSNNFGSSFTTY
jgi:hypothetical protein